MSAIINLSSWNGVVPVLLPLGQPTISAIGVASAGVAVPFFLYVVAMFMLVLPIWMQNFDSDKKAATPNTVLSVGGEQGRISIAVNGGISMDSDSYMLQGDASFPPDFRMRQPF